MAEVQLCYSVGLLSFKKGCFWFPDGLATCNGIYQDRYIFSCAAHSICMPGSVPMFHFLRITINSPEYLSTTFNVTHAVLSKQWLESGKIDCDVAFLSAVPREGPCSQVEEIDPLWESPKGDVAAKLVKRRKKHHCVSNQRQIHSIDVPITLLSTRVMAQANQNVGDSGGPWLINKGGKPKQFSNTSFRIKSDRSYSYGPIWNSEVKELFSEAVKKLPQSNRTVHLRFGERKKNE